MKESIGQQFGRLGGKATLKKYGKKHFQEMNNKRKNWPKKYRKGEKALKTKEKLSPV